MSEDSIRACYEIFTQAIELPRGEREAFARRRCGADAALLREVLGMLEADSSDTALLSRSAVSGKDLEKHRFIGPYRLLELIGEGGFGSVWLAERREPMVQRVAIKVIRAGKDSGGVIARFEQERQALALMDHPCIARVLDAGEDERKLPYFVMEYVRGLTITEYCDKRRLSIAERLGLFILVCDAVQHAHMKGIIHRDLKPSNVLVTDTESGPIPKVIDFGVAKAINHVLTGKTVFTQVGQIVGTPEYMSPEQADVGSADIDTRTDVYSLGVLLYELLSGVLPFDPAELRSKGYHEIFRILREVDPPTPSRRLTSIGQAPGSAAGAPSAVSVAGIAAARKIDASDLARELRRELDWIPLKAMRKDRAGRYASAADLSRDVRNYLEGRPLVAGPESVAYRVRKFVRRRRGLVVGGGAVLLALLAGLATTSLALVRAREAERGARALISMARGTLHSIVDPDAPRTVDAAAVLAEFASQIDRVDVAPALKADLLLMTASGSYGQGRYAEAEQAAKRAAELLTGGDDAERRVRAHAVLAASLAAQERAQEGEAVAAPLLKEPMPLAADHPAMLEALVALVDCRLMLRSTAQVAPPAADETLALLDRAIGLLEKSHEGQGSVSEGNGGGAGAGWVFRLRARRGELALVSGAGNLERIAEELKGVVGADEVIFGPRHRETLLTRSRLGRVLCEAQLADQGLAQLRASYEALGETLGHDHQRTLIVGMQLARAARDAEKEELLEWLMPGLVEALSQRYGPASAAVGDATQLYVDALLSYTKGEKSMAPAASNFLSDVIDRASAAARPDPVTLMELHLTQAEVAAQLKGPSAAVRMFDEVIERDASRLDARDPARFAARARRGRFLLMFDMAAEALAEFEPLARDVAAALSPGHRETLKIRLDYASALAHNGRIDEAVAIVREVESTALASFGPRDVLVKTAREVLANAPAK